MKMRQAFDIISRFDLVTGAVFLAIGATGLLIANSESRWLDAFSRGEETVEGTVAELRRDGGAVRYRRGDSVFWQDLGRQGWFLDGGDAAFTGPDGYARLVFESGGEAELAPNTLVVVERPAQKLDWQMKWLWRVLAEAAPEMPARLNVHDGKVRVKLREGDAPVEVGSAERRVRVEAPSGPSEVLVDAIAERGSERIRILNVGDSPAQVRELGGGEDKAARELASGAEHALALPADAARVAALESPGTVTDEASRWTPVEYPLVSPAGTAVPEPPADLRVSKAKKIQDPWKFVASPDSGSREVADVADLKQMTVRLVWQPADGARSYLVQVSAKDASSGRRLPIAQPRPVSEPAVEVPLRNPGVTAYFFEVIAVQASGKRVSSGVRPLRVSLAPPELRLPADGVSIPAGKRVLLTWAKTRLTQSYRLQLATDAGFTKVVEEHDASTNYFMPRTLKPGRYFWRVRALSTFSESDWSGFRSFQSR